LSLMVRVGARDWVCFYPTLAVEKPQGWGTRHNLGSLLPRSQKRDLGHP